MRCLLIVSVNCAIIVDRKDCADLLPPTSKLVILGHPSRRPQSFLQEANSLHLRRSCSGGVVERIQAFIVSQWRPPSPRVSRLMSICEIRRECWRVESE